MTFPRNGCRFVLMESCSEAPTFSEAMRQGAEVYQRLKTIAKKEYGQSAGNVGDEGGIAPDIQTADEALKLITSAIEQAGYTGKVKIAMDVSHSLLNDVVDDQGSSQAPDRR